MDVDLQLGRLVAFGNAGKGKVEGQRVVGGADKDADAAVVVACLKHLLDIGDGDGLAERNLTANHHFIGSFVIDQYVQNLRIETAFLHTEGEIEVAEFAFHVLLYLAQFEAALVDGAGFQCTRVGNKLNDLVVNPVSLAFERWLKAE